MQRSTNGGRPGFDGRQDEGAGGWTGIRPYVGAVQQLGAAHPHRNGPIDPSMEVAWDNSRKGWQKQT
jgi:hypothetical protein